MDLNGFSIAYKSASKKITIIYLKIIAKIINVPIAINGVVK